MTDGQIERLRKLTNPPSDKIAFRGETIAALIGEIDAYRARESMERMTKNSLRQVLRNIADSNEPSWASRAAEAALKDYP